jgi:hypothetical protein
MRGKIAALGIVGLVMLAGCGAYGPKTVVRDRFNYNSAIAESWKNQMLQNVVRIRYADMPVFLEVSSVVSQYEIKGDATARADSGLTSPLEIGGSYTERPTISYAPLTGEKFIKSLMTPLPPEVILHLIEMGWPAEFILGLSVQAVNGLYNRAGGQMVSHPADPDFNALLASLTSIQQSGVLVSEVEKHDGDDEIVLMFREHPDAKVQSEIASVFRLLRLDPDSRRFSVSGGICPAEGNEIKFETRSILMIMHALAMGVEVPSTHGAETINAAAEPVDERQANLSPVKVVSGEKRPDDAYAAIQYRSHWFWIESDDVQSKRAFSFIQLLMNFSEGGTGNNAPVLTLPTG